MEESRREDDELDRVMNGRLSILFITFALVGCNSYSNKERYSVSVGEDVEIYYATNSCCYYCVSNEKLLKQVKLIDRKILEEKEDCDGCDYNGAFVFRAESAGIDTVELKRLNAKVSCDSSEVQPERYIIEVK